VLGVINESDAEAYALVKEERPDGGEPDYYGGDLTVIQLKQRGSRWAVVPRGDLLPDVGVNIDPESCRR
jgi:hypothetical protein